MPIPSKNWGLDLSSQDMQYLKNYYHKLLCDCKLSHRCTAEDILSEVQQKANKVNRLECQIENSVAWAKKVGERIIFQKRRKEASEKKFIQKVNLIAESKKFSITIDDIYHDDNLRLLVVALNELKQLKPDFYQLIMMRFFGELSWEDISSKRYPDIEITKIIIDRERKKGSRALKKLREIFLSKLENY